MSSEIYYQKMKEELQTVRRITGARMAMLVDRVGIVIARDSEKPYDFQTLGPLFTSWYDLQEKIAGALHGETTYQTMAISENHCAMCQEIASDILLVLLLHIVGKEDLVQIQIIDEAVVSLQKIVTEVKNSLRNVGTEEFPIIDREFVEQLEQEVDRLFED